MHVGIDIGRMPQQSWGLRGADSSYILGGGVVKPKSIPFI